MPHLPDLGLADSFGDLPASIVIGGDAECGWGLWLGASRMYECMVLGLFC